MARIIYVDERGRRVRPPKQQDRRRGRDQDDTNNAAAAMIAFALVGGIAAATHGHFPGAGHAAGGTAAAAGVRPPAAVAGVLGSPGRNPGPVARGHHAGEPWSIFTQGGGPRAAVTWAKEFLHLAGLPVDAATVRFVYDWEVSEGGGGLYNPINTGPVPGRPDLTSTGQQYGGGAADYRTWQAGLTGSVLYLRMPNYAGVLAALARSDYGGARSALERSPWAGSHYGYGARWHADPVPGT